MKVQNITPYNVKKENIYQKNTLNTNRKYNFTKISPKINNDIFIHSSKISSPNFQGKLIPT